LQRRWRREGGILKIDLGDKIILVTGAASGIGRAVAIHAANSGARVALADVSAEGCNRVAEEIRSLGGQAFSAPFNVRDTAAVEKQVAAIEEEFGPIFGLVAAAGISSPVPAELLNDNGWETVIDINLTGVFRCIRSVGKRMIQRRAGSIVTISSVDGFGGHSARSHYVATKFGVIGLTKSLAVEWGRHGIRTNAVAPGAVDTDLLRRNIPPTHVEGVMIDRVPLGRLSRAEEQAAACIFLLSDMAGYVNGAVLTVDGGLTAGFFTARHGGDYASNKLLEAGYYDLTQQ
jgi:NAD(P)-dependent dehydrogenase (short-subunit alcohol dehydrogenase family)